MPSSAFLLLAFAFFVNTFCISVLAGEHHDWESSNPYGYRQVRKYPCRKLLQRREWRTLSNNEKADYIKAVQCLQSHDALDPPIKEAKSRFDEFQAYHILQADKVHNLGQFLPWHRHFVRNYELALQSECGYKGATPYWDWSQDADQHSSISASPVFDPIYGFGGDGVPGTYTLPPNIPLDSRVDLTAFHGCVKNGPFSNYTVRLGPGKLVGDHCLVRGIKDDAGKYMSSAAVANATKCPTYELFRVELEGMPVTSDHRMHDGGHDAVGGDMSNFYSSPGDPLFYLHHANLDRIWWQWQQMVPSRIYELSGPSTKVAPIYNISLDYPLQMGNLGPTVPVRDVMDLYSEPNCYTYV